jgi:hypothetical protein
MKLAKLERDPGFNPRGTIPMDGLPFCRPIQATLQFREKFQGFILLSSGDQRKKLLLRQSSIIQKTTIHHPTPKGGSGLFRSRSSVGHNLKSCPKLGGGVNP